MVIQFVAKQFILHHVNDYNDLRRMGLNKFICLDLFTIFLPKFVPSVVSKRVIASRSVFIAIP